MSTEQNTACITIDAPGVSATIVLRGPEVPAGQPSRDEAMALLERVLDHARSGATAPQPEEPDHYTRIREQAARETAEMTAEFNRNMAIIEGFRAMGETR